MSRILLVDDEPAVLGCERKAICECSKEMQIVAEAYSVSQAIELFDRLKPDIVISDIRMPERSGIELIQYINEKKDSTAITIVVSGYAEFEYVRDAFVYGAMDYILKPINGEKLAQILEKADGLLKQIRNSTEEQVDKGETLNFYERVCNYLKRNIHAENSALQICSEFGISQSQLGRLFKKKANMSYNEFLTNLRITKAKELLQNDADIYVGEVASLVGFNDQYYFSKVFKKVTGETPRDYRNKQRK